MLLVEEGGAQLKESDKVHKLFVSVTHKGTHRGAKVVSYFMRKSDMGDFRRYVGGIVLYGDNTSVERLLFSI